MRFAIIFLALLFSIPTYAGLPKVTKVKKEKPADQVDVDQLLIRVEATKSNFQGATKSIKQGREMLFEIAATQERKNQLKEMEVQRDAAQSDEERECIDLKIEQVQDEEIQRARESGELENKRLEAEQAKNIGKLSYNIALAIRQDQKTVEHGSKIISDGQTVIDNAKSDPMQAAKMGSKLNQVTQAVTTEIPTILKEAPHQLETLAALLEATNVLRKNNDIPDKGQPTENDKYEEIDF